MKGDNNMIAMQYNINLPSDYDMKIIKKRVEENGHKTDGFKDLVFKAYLLTENGKDGNIQNTYEPLYLWGNSDGMNNFIFNGYFDNILNSFGWININIGITYAIELQEGFQSSQYILEEYKVINPIKSLRKICIKNDFEVIDDNSGEVIIYNPDKWKYVKYTFIKQRRENIPENMRMLKISHISIQVQIYDVK